MTEETPFAIPESWTWKPLDEVAEINPTLDRDQVEEDPSVSFVPMKRVEELSGQIDLTETRPISEVASRYTYFAEEDVIFAKITPCMENGKTAIAKGLENGVGFGSTEFHVVRPSDDLLNSWAFYYLIQEGFRRDAKRRMTGSAGQKRVPTGYMEKVQLPVPPLPEQRRIVAKIEELFSDLEAGFADLKRAQKQLQRYRQSVLQAAVEGRLTKDWREEHGSAVEAFHETPLRERILEERQAQWEKDYRAKYEAKGKGPPSGWKSRYKPPEEPDVSDLPELPKGWVWTGLHSLYTWSNGNGLPEKKRKEGPHPVYGGNGVAGHHSEYMIEDSALIVGRVGANCGNVHIAPGKSWVTDNAIYSNWKSDLVEHNFLLTQLRNKRLNQLAGGTGQPYISQKLLKTLAVALPPLEEQCQIVNEVERLLSVAEEATQTVEREIKRAERLRQSILKQAFSGRLASCDAEERPARDGQMALDL